MIRSLIKSLSPKCYHSAEKSIDESGDGTTVEWQCIFCGRIRIQDDYPA